jgi:hypothetical protein
VFPVPVCIHRNDRNRLYTVNVNILTGLQKAISEYPVSIDLLSDQSASRDYQAMTFAGV